MMAPPTGIEVFHSVEEAAKIANLLGIHDSEAKLRLLRGVLAPGKKIPRHWLSTAPKSGFVSMMEQPLDEIMGIRDTIFKLQKPEYGLSEKKCREICKGVFLRNAIAFGRNRPNKQLSKDIVSRNLAEYFRIAKKFGFTPAQAIKPATPERISLIITQFDAEKNIERLNAKKRAMLRRFALRQAPRGTPKSAITSWLNNPAALKTNILDAGLLGTKLQTHLKKEIKKRKPIFRRRPAIKPR